MAEDQGTRVCRKCNAEKPISEFRNARGNHGFICVGCTKAYRADWQRRNPEKIAAKKRRYKERHPESSGEYARRPEVKNRKNAAARTRHAIDPEPRRAQNRDAARRVRQKNPDRVRAKRRAWYSENREYFISLKNAYEARKRGDLSEHTLAEVMEIFHLQRGRCAYCPKNLGDSFHVDHIQPTSKGGSNDRRNLQLTCAPCNIRKHAKDPIDFARSLGLLL